MTNKEAIEKLKEILFMTGYKEALDFAIKVLEESEKGLCDDCQEFPCDYSQEFPRYKCDFHVPRGG